MYRHVLLATLVLALFVPLMKAQDAPKAERLTWERVAMEVVDGKGIVTQRAKVANGWLYLVRSTDGVAITFVPDPSPVKDKRPRRGVEKVAPAAELDAARREALEHRKRAEEALRQAEAIRDLALKSESLAKDAHVKEEAARKEALLAREKAEVIAQELKRQNEIAVAEGAKAMAELRKLQAEVEQVRRDADRLKQLLDKSK